MPETIIESVLSGKLDCVLLIKWLNNKPIEEDCILLCCEKSEFVACFLSYLRNQTDSILSVNSNTVQIQTNTPEKVLSSRRKHHRSISDPTSDDRDNVTPKNDSKSYESPQDRKRPGRRVKTKLFSDDRKDTNTSISSEESRLSTSIDRMAISSTPLKNGLKPSDYPNLSLSSPVTPRNVKDHDRCDTPRLGRHSRSHEKSCLGDFIVTATKSSKKKSKKNISNESEEKVELDLSNSEMFPEIGARKSSSLRSEMKRIKPTNIDKSQKSLSLNSFNDSFRPHENSAFKQQKFHPKETTSFEAERNILKQERHKLMEKFNILNTSAPQVTLTPQIDIRKESIEVSQSYVKVDVTKILLKEKIELLIDIYDNLLKNNLILSMITEIYFLISVLISSQNEDEYIKVESKLIDNNIEYILKSIHNSSYFAVKSLWNLRSTLEVILDKNSLKTLGENKIVRNFFPDLAKFLLNCYCVRCEGPPANVITRGPAVVCYNTETDSVDNFPSTQAFHNFKKQRDMFYEIVRWYQETQSTGASKSTFRARIKALTSHSATPSNHAHLASLFVAHMIAECLPDNTQESKLSKLQRRLTCPAVPESHRLPTFTANEMFYKDFIMNAENESFRAHLKDALSTEIVTLDSMQFSVEDRGNANIDISREYIQLARKLNLLAKLLGLLHSLPYTAAPDPAKTTAVNGDNSAPKEKVLENSLAMRNYSQPSLDLEGILQNALQNNRLALTIPWIVNFLSILDFTTLRLNYYQKQIKTLLEIYHSKLTPNNEQLFKKNTVIYLKSILGWFFDLPQYTSLVMGENSVGTDNIDGCDLIDDSIFELCPCLKDVNTLLSTCRLTDNVGSFRHITPVSLNVDPQARSRNKEKELQARLEEELLKSQPSSSRRVLEMVIERVTSAAVRELSARELLAARAKANEHVASVLASEGGRSHAALLSTVTSIYNTHLQQLRAAALESARAPLAARARAALTALLPAAPQPLQSVACRAAKNRLSNWINDHWNTTAILCKDIESEMKTILSLNELRVPVTRAPASVNASLVSCDESPAMVLIHMKEHICLLLDDDVTTDVSPILHRCARAVASINVFCRAPTQRALMQLTVDLCLVYGCWWGCPGSAVSGMFADARVDCFYTTMPKRCTSLVRRIRASSNGILNAFSMAKKPSEINEVFLTKVHNIWNTCCPERKHYSPIDISFPERREDLSPELRNFTDDRLPTPISDEDIENVNGIDENHGLDQNLRPISPILKPIDPNTQPISPITKTIGVTTLPISPITKTIGPSTQPISPVTKTIGTIVNSKSKSNPVTPLKRITPITYPMSPKIQTFTQKQATSPKQQMTTNSIYSFDRNMQPIDRNSKPIDRNSKPIDRNSKPIDRNTQPIDPKRDNNVTFEETNEHLLEFFDRILCPRNIVMLSASKAKPTDVWEALAIFLVFLLKNDYLSEDSLTEQCLAVYRQDWPQSILESLSACMKAVSSRWSRSSAGKFTLFLDFLAEYCGDMDYEITE